MALLPPLRGPLLPATRGFCPLYLPRPAKQGMCHLLEKLRPDKCQAVDSYRYPLFNSHLILFLPAIIPNVVPFLFLFFVNQFPGTGYEDLVRFSPPALQKSVPLPLPFPSIQTKRGKCHSVYPDQSFLKSQGCPPDLVLPSLPPRFLPGGHSQSAGDGPVNTSNYSCVSANC